MSLIGIDLGTSFIKAGVLDVDRLHLAHVQRIPFPEALPQRAALYREFNPASVMTAVHAVLRQLAPLASDCEGVVMCSQMHGVVFTSDTGEAHSNLTTWQDQRVLETHPSGAGSYFDVLRARLSSDDLRQLGNELRPGLPVGLFFWMAEQGKTPASALIPASLADFVIANLCGAQPVTDSTNAMAHGLLNLETGDWHQEILYKLGLNVLHLPVILPHGAVAGWMAWNGRRIPCYTPVGDYQCAMVGALLEKDELSLNISTGSQVSLLKPEAVFGNFQTRPFFDGQFANTITHIPAGRALNALVKLFSELALAQGVALDDTWAYIVQEAARIGSPAMKANLAFYSSACGSEGAFTHLHEDELTVGCVFRAAFESMAQSYYQFARRLSPEQDWSRLVFSGGLVQKIDLLRDLICDLFDAPYRMSPAAEDTLLGLLGLGLAFTKRTTTVGEAVGVLSQAYPVQMV